MLEKLRVKDDKIFNWGFDGGFMISVHSNIVYEMRMYFERLVSWYGKKELIPVYPEYHIFIFFDQRSEVHRNQYFEQFSPAWKRKSYENSEQGSGFNW